MADDVHILVNGGLALCGAKDGARGTPIACTCPACMHLKLESCLNVLDATARALFVLEHAYE